MANEIRVPTLGESITEATVGEWMKKEGDRVSKDEILVELETEKVTVELPSPSSGILGAISANEGDTLEIGGLLAVFSKVGEEAGEETGGIAAPSGGGDFVSNEASASADVSPVAATRSADGKDGPAVQRIAHEENIDPATVSGSGRDGRVTKGDMLKATATAGDVGKREATTVSSAAPTNRSSGEREVRKRMPKIRQVIASRLKESQNTAATLSTFNEIDMSAVMGLRKSWQDDFVARHGVKLGFMSLFLKATVAALKDHPDVNARIDGTDIVYHNFFDIGVAVSTERGLVVPVVRDVDQLGLADIEKSIVDFGTRARTGQLGVDEMHGATFTVTNGGIFGSLLSTPIINSPQSAILGMHKIEQRAVVIGGEIVVRPMMYVALSYDHRMVDGKGAVTFLVRVKESIENPTRMMLGI